MSGEGRLVFTQEQNYTDIAAAIREKLGVQDTFKPGEMAAAIQSIQGGGDGIPMKVEVGDDVPWTRPVEWPNIESIPVDVDGNEEVVYLTYDNTAANAAWHHWAGFQFNGSAIGAYAVIERGTVANGVFTPYASYDSPAVTKTTNAVAAYVDYSEDEHDYIVFRITCSGGHFTQLFFREVPAATTGTAYQMYALNNRCVERTGSLPYITSITTAGANTGTPRWGTAWLQRDSVVIGRASVVTIIQGAWAQCQSLRSLDVSRWRTTNWNIKTLGSLFYWCTSLTEVDLSAWDTSKWAVTTMGDMCNNAISLRRLDLRAWDTSNWAVTNLASAFNLCYSLEELHMETFDTSKWKVTSLSSMFNTCESLVELDLSGWDTSGWAVTTLASTWFYCRALRKLKIGTWDTEDWAVTSLASTWASCHSLDEIEATGWDTSNWAVTTLASTFNACYCVKELDLNGWDTENWAVTTLSGTWATCWSLRTLKVDKWDTSGWAVTNIGSMLNSCFSLPAVDLSKWDTSNWPVTSFSQILYYCVSLREFDVSAWNFSKWNVTAAQSNAFAYVCNLRKIKLGGWPWNATALPSIGGCTHLQVTDGFKNVAGNFSLNGTIRITHDSLMAVFNKLATVSGKTLTLAGVVWKQLSAADLAVATSKGWTVTGT